MVAPPRSSRQGSTTRRARALLLSLVSLGLLGVLVLMLMWLGGYFRNPMVGVELNVYCASGVRPAIEKIAQAYEKMFKKSGVWIRLHSASSGVLEQQIKQAGRGDLYIPAATDPFITRMRAQGLVDESIALAEMRLVLAVHPRNKGKIKSLSDLVSQNLRCAVCVPQAAVGDVTEKILSKTPHWEKIKNSATFKSTVTELANDLQLDVGVDAAFLWDATARQFGLEVVELPELKGAVGQITAGVLGSTEHPTEALRFVRYLAAPEKGQPAFEKLHYHSVDGDAWAVEPELVLYSGGVNRVAVQETIKEFERREGCRIVATYQGCGSLVTMMKTDQNPDVYFACDLSFVREVKDRFLPGVTISKTDMVLLVRKGNPKNIRSLADLARDGLKVGWADEQLTALGALTKRLLESEGIYAEALKNRSVTTPTADTLVIQLTQSEPLDVVIVYEANCNYIGDQGEIVRIKHPQALAVQPFAILKQTKYPQLTARLLEAISSSKSRQRFEQTGFQWQMEAKGS